MAAKSPKPPESSIKNKEDNFMLDNTNINQYQYHSNDKKNLSPTSSALKENFPILQQNLEQLEQQNICMKFQTKNNCSCTNISIMQLFHEMKQKFPTVPDHIVNNCVVNNCHDRENCIRILQDEFNFYSSTSQSYPSNALRNQNTVNISPTLPLQQHNLNTIETTVPKCRHIDSINDKNNKVLKPVRPAPVPQQNLINKNSNVAQNINLNTDKFVKKKPFVSNTNQQHSHNQQQISQLKASCDNHELGDIIEKLPVTPQRPTTLKFREPTLFDNRLINKNSNNSCLEPVTHKTNNIILLKPVRRAPAPPIGIVSSPSTGNLTPLSSSSSHFATPSTSSQSIQSPFSDTAESEISVNISLSPTSEHSRITTTTSGQHAQPQTPRRVTSISLQPEPPYTRDFLPNPNIKPSQRSFTSLNLTLRKPSNTPQSPIDITAGPGLTYSSSSFDAGRGLQKSFHISVNTEGGVFRASSIRPKSLYTPNVPHVEEEFRNIGPPNALRPVSSEQDFYKNLMDNTCDNFNRQVAINSSVKKKVNDVFTVQLVDRQKHRKEQLIKAIEKNRKKLQQVKDEIHILKSPALPGESERLDNDIELLRSCCEQIFNEIENSKRLIGQQNTVIANEYNYNVNQTRQRPPRPPPPRSLNLTGSQQILTTTSSTSSSPLSNSVMFSASPNQITPTLPLDSNASVGITTTPATPVNNFNDDEDGPQWSCKHCTFLNDPLMIRCENCDYDREIPGIINSPNNNNGLLTNSPIQSESMPITTSNGSFVYARNFANNNMSTTAYNC